VAEFVVTFDAAGATTAFKYIADRAANLTPAMDEIEQMLLTSTDQRFEAETDPAGHRWTPLAPSTSKRKAAAGRERILQWSTRLRRSVTGKHDAHSVTIGTNVIYAAIQQFGGTIARPEREATVRLRNVSKMNKAGDARINVVRFAKASHKKARSVDVNIPAHDIRLPARPLIGISQPDLSAAVDILRKFVGVTGGSFSPAGAP
jgi:phage virion morphogenesis protein